MNFKKAFTPKDTEEIKPGLFIQTKYKDNNGVKEPAEYRKVLPIVWNGEWKTKEQLKTIFSARTFFTIAIVLFLAWSYLNDVQEYEEFYYNINADPIGFCSEVYKIIDTDLCNEQNEKAGLCNSRDVLISNFSGLDIVIYKP